MGGMKGDLTDGEAAGLQRTLGNFARCLKALKRDEKEASGEA